MSLLEIQVVEIEEDITGLNIGLAEVDENVDFLFDETVIQDERLFSLEQTTVEITAELVAVDDELEGNYTYTQKTFRQLKQVFDNFNVVIAGLQDITLDLDSRVTVLEENGGSDGNSSVAELEVRVETLEGTAVDHETRLTAAETDIDG